MSNLKCYTCIHENECCETPRDYNCNLHERDWASLEPRPITIDAKDSITKDRSDILKEIQSCLTRSAH